MKFFTFSFKERKVKAKKKRKRKVEHGVESSVIWKPMTHTYNGMTTAGFKTTYDMQRQTPFAVRASNPREQPTVRLQHTAEKVNRFDLSLDAAVPDPRFKCPRLAAQGASCVGFVSFSLPPPKNPRQAPRHSRWALTLHTQPHSLCCIVTIMLSCLIFSEWVDIRVLSSQMTVYAVAVCHASSMQTSHPLWRERLPVEVQSSLSTGTTWSAVITAAPESWSPRVAGLGIGVGLVSPI